MILKPQSKDFFLNTEIIKQNAAQPAGKEIQFLWCKHFFGVMWELSICIGVDDDDDCDDYNVGYFRPSAGQRQAGQDNRQRDKRLSMAWEDLPPHLRQYLVRFIVTSPPSQPAQEYRNWNLVILACVVLCWAVCSIRKYPSFSSQIDSQLVIKRLPLSSVEIRQKMFLTVWCLTSVRISSWRCSWPLYIILWNNDVNHCVAQLSHSNRI